MQLYSYWARATSTTPDADGNPLQFIAYAGSDDSPATARARAEALANERANRLLVGEEIVGHPDDYPTEGVPMREHVVRRLPDSRGG